MVFYTDGFSKREPVVLIPVEYYSATTMTICPEWMEHLYDELAPLFLIWCTEHQVGKSPAPFFWITAYMAVIRSELQPEFVIRSLKPHTHKHTHLLSFQYKPFVLKSRRLRPFVLNSRIFKRLISIWVFKNGGNLSTELSTALTSHWQVKVIYNI